MTMARFELVVDGTVEESDVDMADFFAANDLDPEEAGAILALQPGDEYVDGGGAAPIWCLRRVS
jgi:hypothetical protein